MNKQLLFILFLLSSVVCLAALSEKEKLMLRELTRDELKVELKKIRKELEKQISNPCSTKLSSISNRLKIYTIHPFVAADTGIRKRWFVAACKSLKQMAQIKSQQELAMGTRNRKAFKKLAGDYAQEYASFERLLKKPVMVKKSDLKSLRKTARLKRRELERRLE